MTIYRRVYSIWSFILDRNVTITVMLYVYEFAKKNQKSKESCCPNWTLRQTWPSHENPKISIQIAIITGAFPEQDLGSSIWDADRGEP